MGYRGHILDHNHIESGSLKRSKSRLPTGTRSLDIDLDISHAMLHGFFCSVFGSKLGRKGGAFTRAFETLDAGA